MLALAWPRVAIRPQSGVHYKEQWSLCYVQTHPAGLHFKRGPYPLTSSSMSVSEARTINQLRACAERSEAPVLLWFEGRIISTRSWVTLRSLKSAFRWGMCGKALVFMALGYRFLMICIISEKCFWINSLVHFVFNKSSRKAHKTALIQVIGLNQSNVSLTDWIFLMTHSANLDSVKW